MMYEDRSSDWTNHYESVLRQEIGDDKYEEAIRKLQEEWEHSEDAPGKLDSMSVSIGLGKVKSWATSHAARLQKAANVATGAEDNVQSHSQQSPYSAFHTDHAVGAVGYAVVVDNPPHIPGDASPLSATPSSSPTALPDNSFFFPGRLFEVRARHCSFPHSTDDSKIGMRMLDIKFADHQSESLWDLCVQTGELSMYYNYPSVVDYMRALDSAENWMNLHDYLVQTPLYLQAFIEGVRLPTSYTTLTYHSQFPYYFVANDGVSRLIKFRIIPKDDLKDSGRPNVTLQKQAWLMDRAIEDSLGRHMLKEDFLDKLQENTVEYMLQCQVYEPPPGAAFEHCMHNPSEAWSKRLYPWNDLIRVCLNHPLHKEVLSISKFELTNLPAVLSIPSAITPRDFCFAVMAKQTMLAAHAYHIPAEPRGFHCTTTDYLVHVVMGGKPDAGTRAKLSLCVVGTDGRTAYRTLGTLSKQSLHKDSKHTYHITDRQVGTFLCAKLHKDNELTSNVNTDCYVQYIVVATLYDKVIYHLPCYRWLTKQHNSVTLRDSKWVLPSEETHEYMSLQRELEVQERLLQYQWQPHGPGEEFDGFPGFLAAGMIQGSSVPRDSQFPAHLGIEDMWEKDIHAAAKNATTIKRGLSEMFSFMFAERPFDEKASLIADLGIKPTATMKHVLQEWRSDQEFGRKVLQGPNMSTLRSIREIPENMPITEFMVEEYLEKGTNLKQELQLGKVFLLEYPSLQRVVQDHPDQRLYSCSPMCLLYVRDGNLVPIAIQLTQHPRQNTPMFTPADDNGLYSDWLIAKMWVWSADVNHQLYATHMMRTHLVMEPCILALLRNLPSVHPVYKLMEPHMQHTLATNTIYRTQLLKGGKLLSRLMAVGEDGASHLEFLQEVYRSFTFDSLNPRVDLEARGMLFCPQLSHSYPYAKQCVSVWGLIEGYIGEMVELFYQGNDEKVQEDVEMQNVLRDLNTNGYHQGVGLPDRFMDQSSVVSFLTTVLYTVTYQHSAVSQGLLDHYGYPPAALPAFLTPPGLFKHAKGLEALEVKKMLPTHEDSLMFTALMRLMSAPRVPVQTLDSTDYKLLISEESQVIVKRFHDKLRDLLSSPAPVTLSADSTNNQQEQEHANQQGVDSDDQQTFNVDASSESISNGTLMCTQIYSSMCC